MKSTEIFYTARLAKQGQYISIVFDKYVESYNHSLQRYAIVNIKKQDIWKSLTPKTLTEDVYIELKGYIIDPFSLDINKLKETEQEALNDLYVRILSYAKTSPTPVDITQLISLPKRATSYGFDLIPEEPEEAKIPYKHKLMLMGYARHGKDTVAEILRDHYGVKFTSSSLAASELFVFDTLKDKYGYLTPEECFADRVNHREEWYQLIKEYNTPDLTRLMHKIYENNDLYCGIRDAEEFWDGYNKAVFDIAIWVNANLRKPAEKLESCSVDITMADIVLDNNGTIEDLEEAIVFLALDLFLLPEYSN